MSSLIRASDIQPEPVEWLLEGRIPLGCLTAIAGRPGQGKSMFTVWLAAQVSKRGINAVFSSREDSHSRVVRPRLEAAGADLERVIFASERLWLPRDFVQFAELVVAARAKLVVLDPIAAHFSRFSMVDDRTVLQPLADLAEELQVAIVGVHHMPKSVARNGDKLQAIGGASGGLGAAARAAFIWGPNPNDGECRVLAYAKGNWDEEPPSMVFEFDSVDVAVRKGKATTFRPYAFLDLLDDKSTIDGNAVIAAATSSTTKAKVALVGKTGRAIEWLENYLAFGPRPSAEVLEDATQFGITPATLRVAREQIGVVHERVGGKDGYLTTALPPGHRALLEEVPGDDDE